MQYSRGPPTIEDSASSSRSPDEPFKIDFLGTKSERDKNIWKRLSADTTRIAYDIKQLTVPSQTAPTAGGAQMGVYYERRQC